MQRKIESGIAAKRDIIHCERLDPTRPINFLGLRKEQCFDLIGAQTI